MPVQTQPLSVDTAGIDAGLALLLGGQADVLAPHLADTAVADQIAARIRVHGIALALLALAPVVQGWPAPLLGRIREEARLQVLWEASHREVVEEVLSRLHALGIEVLVMKGTALAYLVYDEPAMRRRGDSDILVRQGRLRDVRKVFANIGLVPTGDRTFGQETWQYQTGIGFVHAIDLHWEAVGSPYLRRVLAADECFDQAVPLPRLAAEARSLSPVLLLLRGLLNQMLHHANGYLIDEDMHYETDRLIWQMDTHLLASGFTDEEWRHLQEFAIARGLAAPCRDALAAARQAFGTPLPGDVMAALAARPDSSEVVRYAALESGTARLRQDFTASAGFVEKVRLLASFVVPPGEFMRRRFPGRAAWPLPLLHVCRIASGLTRFTRRGRG